MEKIKIGEVFTEKERGMSFLCAEVSGLGETKKLWYAVDEKNESMLSGSGECFILGLLLKAMETGQDLYYAGSLSRRFLHELNEYLIPSVTAARKLYHNVKVHAVDFRAAYPVTAHGTAMQILQEEQFKAVVEREKRDEYYPLTHLCLFGGVSEHGIPHIQKSIEQASDYGLPIVYLEHNLGELYGSQTKDTACLLELACAAALSGEIERYLYRAENALSSDDNDDKNDKNMDVVFCSFASAEPMKICLFDKNEECVC